MIYIQENEKYEELKKHIETLKEGDSISNSYIKRKVQVSYHLAEKLLERLQQDNLIENYQQWIGTTINGVKIDGHEETRYKVSSVSM